MYQIEVQTQKNVRVEEFLEINKPAVLNEHAGKTSLLKCAGLKKCSVRMKWSRIQSSVVLR